MLDKKYTVQLTIKELIFVNKVGHAKIEGTK